MLKLRFLFFSFIAVIGAITLNNIDNSAQSQEAQFQYTGSKKCKMCHSADKKGGQYKNWEASKHSKAYATLASEEAKKIGAGMGIADPQKDPKCLKCHVTAYGTDPKFLGEKYTMEEGVGCESCHGPGEKYLDKKVMEDLSMGKIEPGTVGLIMPTEEVCKKCHNPESPTYKEFVFAEKEKIITHPMPEAYIKEKGYPAK